MSVPTLDELVETFCELHFADSNSSEPWSAFAKRCPGLAISHREDAKRGLLAVLEKHIGPMIAEAFQAGANKVQLEDFDVGFVATQAYATRIIDQIKGA